MSLANKYPVMVLIAVMLSLFQKAMMEMVSMMKSARAWTLDNPVVRSAMKRAAKNGLLTALAFVAFSAIFKLKARLASLQSYASGSSHPVAVWASSRTGFMAGMLNALIGGMVALVVGMGLIATVGTSSQQASTAAGIAGTQSAALVILIPLLFVVILILAAVWVMQKFTGRGM